MRTVPIPGRIMEDTIAFGLSFDELLLMGTFPLVVTMPSLLIEEIPTAISLAIAGVMALAVVVIAIKAPEGQSPISWAPAAFKRRIGPTAYYLRPEESGYDRSTYLSVRHADGAERGRENQ